MVIQLNFPGSEGWWEERLQDWNERGIYPHPEELVEGLREGWANCPPEIQAYVVGRLDGSVPPPRGRRPLTRIEARQARFRKFFFLAQVTRCRSRYERLRVTSFRKRTGRDAELWVKTKSGEYKIKAPLELALRRVGRWYHISPETLRTWQKELASQRKSSGFKDIKVGD